MISSRDQRRQLYERMVGHPVAHGRFVITELLGFGGMGAVYAATQQNMGRSVALKLIPTHDPTTVARFEREAKTISHLHHPNTITVFDYGQSEGGFLFLAMELLEGRTLSDVIREDGPLPPKRAIHIASQICRSLNEAHNAGIVHRDIKPDNIILIPVDSDPDVVKVLDFGIAKAVMGEDDVQLTGDGRIIGTPRYMSPEQILAENLDHRSDIYSLGCILFEMVCGAPPFQQSSTTALMISHTQDPPPAFAQRLPPGALNAMPPGLEHVVRKSLEKNPEHRYADTTAMREALESADLAVSRPPIGVDPDSTAAATPASISQDRKPAVARVPADATMTNPPSESSKAPMVAVALMVLVLIALVLVYVSQNQADPGLKPPVAVEKPIKKERVIVVKDQPKKPGFVEVAFNTEPAGASLLKDGKATGKKTPTMLALMEGEPLDISFELKGYEPYAAQVLPAPNKRVEVKLVKKKRSRRGKSPKTVTKIKPPPVEENVEPKPKPKPKPKPTVDLLDDNAPSVERLD